MLCKDVALNKRNSTAPAHLHYLVGSRATVNPYWVGVNHFTPFDCQDKSCAADV